MVIDVPTAIEKKNRPRANKWDIWAPVVLAVLVALIYRRVAGQDFIRLDDDIHTYANPFYSPGASVLSFWRAPYQGLYIPVAYTLMALVVPFARLSAPGPMLTDTGALFNPHVFHVFNLAVHIANSLLVYVLLRRLVRKEAGALFGALLFAVHPMQVESVAWISEFRGQFAALFSLAGLLAYMDAARKGRARLWVAWMLCSALAILCKPSAVAAPLVAIVLDTFFLKRPLRGALIATVPLLLLFIPIVHATQTLQTAVGDNVTPLWTRPFVAGDALAFYLVKLFAPVPLVLDYGRSPQRILASGVAYYSWLLPAAAGGLIWLGRRRFPWLVGAALVSVAALAPVLGLMPFRFQDLSTVADRYMYVAMLGPAIVAAFAIEFARNDKTLSAVALILAASIFLTLRQVPVWDNSITVFSHSIAVNPNSPLLESNLGSAYKDRGDYRRALVHYDRSIALDAKFFNPYLNRANTYMELGKMDVARADFEDILRRWPKSRMARLRLGQIDEGEGHDDQALKVYDALVADAPDFEPAHVRRGILLLAAHRTGDAAKEFQTAIKQNPYDTDAWTGLGNVASVAGSAELAAQAYARAVQLSPANARAGYDLGLILIAGRRFGDAVSVLKRASAASPGDADLHDTLGVALFDSGDRSAALAQFDEALRIDPRNASANAHAAAVYGVLR